jgi:hypothetical protein
MDSAERCRDQSAECLRLMNLAESAAEATALKNLSCSWVKIANQIGRYGQIMDEKRRAALRQQGSCG